ncbi:hypothetical protein Dda_8498 [Drechslerella dactyloides]|uniref:Ribosomal protein L1 n=1 Tax=Drechslerella dactyloides TaxID=74499 RepID=A0AAD6IQL7_DREDA|nr:hypothetical protein Dda_8498 [Drechslerella dactyloides]
MNYRRGPAPPPNIDAICDIILFMSIPPAPPAPPSARIIDAISIPPGPGAPAPIACMRFCIAASCCGFGAPRPIPPCCIAFIPPFIFLAICAIILCCVRTSSTSRTEVPEPRATRVIRSGCCTNILPSESSSLVVMLSMMYIIRLSFMLPSSSPTSPIRFDRPGIMPAILLSGPIFIMLLSWSRRSRTAITHKTDGWVVQGVDALKMPSAMCFIVSFWSSFNDCTCSTSPCMSPMPSSLEIYRVGSNFSISSICSPVPMNTIGVFVAATLFELRHQYGAAARGVSIRLGDDYRAKVRTLLERLALRLGLLPDARIQHHDRLVRPHGLLDLYHLREQLGLLAMPARGVNDDDLEPLLLELVHARLRHLDGVGLRVGAVVGDLRLGRVLLELVEGARAEGVGADEAGFEAAGVVPSRELCARRRLAGALEADEHYYVGLPLFRLVGLRVRVDEAAEFVKDGLLDEPLLVDALAQAGDELDVDVGFDERVPDLLDHAVERLAELVRMVISSGWGMRAVTFSSTTFDRPYAGRGRIVARPRGGCGMQSCRLLFRDVAERTDDAVAASKLSPALWLRKSQNQPHPPPSTTTKLHDDDADAVATTRHEPHRESIGHPAAAMASPISAAASICRSCLARTPTPYKYTPPSTLLPTLSLFSHAFSTTTPLAALSRKPRSARTTKKKKAKTHWKIWNHAEVPKWALLDAVRYIRAFEVGKDQRQMKYDLAVKLQTMKNGPTVKSRIRLPKAVRTDLRICVFAEGKQADVARKSGAAVVGSTELWEEIKNGKIEFDRVLCHTGVYPAFQKANLGRILGPKGMMPSPKTGTVVGNVADAITAMIGASEYRERTGVVRIAIGQLAFTPEELRENIKTFMDALAKDLARIEDFDKRINEVVLSSTNSPGFSLSGEFRSDLGQDGDGAAALIPDFELAEIDVHEAEAEAGPQHEYRLGLAHAMALSTSTSRFSNAARSSSVNSSSFISARHSFTARDRSPEIVCRARETRGSCAMMKGCDGGTLPKERGGGVGVVEQEEGLEVSQPRFDRDEVPRECLYTRLISYTPGLEATREVLVGSGRKYVYLLPGDRLLSLHPALHLSGNFGNLALHPVDLPCKPHNTKLQVVDAVLPAAQAATEPHEIRIVAIDKLDELALQLAAEVFERLVPVERREVSRCREGRGRERGPWEGPREGQRGEVVRVDVRVRARVAERQRRRHRGGETRSGDGYN